MIYFSEEKKEKDKGNTKPVISLPSNFEHTVHVGYNPSTGEFTGMPKHWEILLQQSKISKQEQQQNPQAVLDALQYYTRPTIPQQKWLNYDNGYGMLFLECFYTCIWLIFRFINAELCGSIVVFSFLPEARSSTWKLFFI